MDILQNGETLDAVYINGPMQTSVSTTDNETQVVAQRVGIRLRTFRGEWWADQDYGVPYFDRIFGTKNSKTVVDAIFQQEILKEFGVRQITSFDSYITPQREYVMTFTATTDSGAETAPITLNLGV